MPRKKQDVTSPPDTWPNVYRIGFTGTKESLTPIQKTVLVNLLAQLPRVKAGTVVIHGGCVGADEFFGAMAWQLGYSVVVRPGKNHMGDSPHRGLDIWDYEYPAEYYIDRNHKIVDNCDLLYACPKTMREERRSGTWATVRYARRIERDHEIIFPDGTVKAVRYGRNAYSTSERLK